jgi:hypothetical protein
MHGFNSERSSHSSLKKCECATSEPVRWKWSSKNCRHNIHPCPPARDYLLCYSSTTITRRVELDITLSISKPKMTSASLPHPKPMAERRKSQNPICTQVYPHSPNSSDPGVPSMAISTRYHARLVLLSSSVSRSSVSRAWA